MKILKGLGIVVAALALLIALLFVGARFSDGPLAIIPGGPLSSGEWVDAGKVDWGFAADIDEIEFESSGRSRTSWVIVHEGEAYIPCSLGFPPGKSWHMEIQERPEAVVRVAGKRYKRKLVKVEDEGLVATLSELAGKKYVNRPPSDAGVWFFQVMAR